MEFKPFRHLAYINNLRSRLKEPLRYNLSDSGCNALTFDQLYSMGAGNSLQSQSLGYATMVGDINFREQVARLYQCKADNVLSFCGAQEALFAAFNYLLSEGDEVIAFAPAYPSLLSVPQQLGATVKTIELEFERNWQWTIADIESRLSDKTKLIVLNSPHNPTGSVMSKDLAKQVVELASQRGIYLISDEVSVWSDYNDLGLDYGFIEYERALVLGVMSKSHGLGGVRVGWAVSKNKALLDGLLNIRGYLSICGSVTDETLATTALVHHDEIIANNNQQLKHNIDLFSQFIKNCQGQFEWVKPQAGILTLVKSNLDIDCHELAEKLAFEQQLLILPGNLFGIEGNYFRLGLGKASFNQTLEKFSTFVAKL